ncbi:hypothetical protein PGQ11_010007 [Apiospora arundinis]|uniref:Uncharacterized protein n=1 Tax=Apiospora arundinis TaxID=335852 RepID=A0ABR2I973_9PEZI
MTNSTDAVFAGNGTAFTIESYCLTTAVHAIPLSLQPHVGCDSDFQVVIIILFLAFLYSWGALIFSPEIFNINIQPLCTIWIPILLPAIMITTKSLSRYLDSVAEYTADVKVVAEAESPDPCSIFEPQVLFRGGPNDGLNAVLFDRWTTWNDTRFTNNTIVVTGPSESIIYPFMFNYYSIILFIPLLIIGSLNFSRPPRDWRRSAFQYMLRGRVPKPGNGPLQRVGVYLMLIVEALFYLTIYPFLLKLLPERFPGDRLYEMPWIHRNTDVRYLSSTRDIKCAKYMALLCYLIFLLGYPAWPAITLWFVIVHEIMVLNTMPESEKLFAVGQWAPWVGFALSGLIVIIYELRKRSNKQKQGDDQLPPLTRDGSEVASSGNAGDQKKRFWELTVVVDTFTAEWRDLQTWWRNPVERADTDGAPVATPNHETTPEAIPLEELSSGIIRTRTRTW